MNADIDQGGFFNATGDAPLSAIGKYRVDGIIGRGAVGVVYKCFDPNICRPVAIKTLRREVLAHVDDPHALLQRFASEARAAGGCQHPNIVTVFDYVEQDDAPFIIMEYVSAGTLDNITHSRMLLPLHQVGEIMAQLLSALEHAHSKGVIHRDIKPANILCPAATSIKVTDFGVARFQDLGLTRGGGGALGTPNYMSPEQFLGRDVDGRADLFAAGVILFQLLTGTKPYTASDIPELMRKLLNQPPPPLGTLRPELPANLNNIVQTALARNPTDRFQSASAFASALMAALDSASSSQGTELIDLTRIPPRLPTDTSDSSRASLNRTMAERLTQDTLGQLEEKLARSIGPIARLVLVRASRETVDADQFLSHLTSHIRIPKEAEAFRSSAERWLRDDQGIAGAQLDAVISEAEVKEAIGYLLPIIGPVAKVIAEREARTAIGREDYYVHLARAIGDDKDRARFLKRHAPDSDVRRESGG
ncbi:MAG: serine/threonine-protein kinase [Hyphomicrobium sp.]